MYNPKFNYTPVPRVEVNGKRFYATPDGNKLPSVTTILDKTKPEEKKLILEQWRKRVLATKRHNRSPQRLPTVAHVCTPTLEHYVKNGELKDRGTNPFGWASHAMAQVVIDQGITDRVNEFWGYEVPLYFPKVYAGTTDAAGVHLNEESHPRLQANQQTQKTRMD
jgi:hypothetical protein